MSRDALAVEPIRNGGCSLGPILALRTHTTILRYRTTQEPAQEDGTDERGKHRHEWEDHRPMGSPPLRQR
ncbi:unnamed protein product [Lasius platythorax]|uniref:Uncharacterized protein n=1 Tax=Lasius platythorax TaxID=488582 RepID=A0AAV2N630_9HYME